MSQKTLEPKKFHNSEDLLSRIDTRDQALKGLIIILVIIALGLSYLNNISLRQIINDNQAQAITRSKQNKDRQDQLTGYIKCIFLARFDHPELASPKVTKQQVAKALDECADSTKPKD